MSPSKKPGDDDISRMAVSVFDKVKRIKAENPALSRKIDGLEVEIRKKILEIRALVEKFDARDRDLIKVLIINGLHRTADEVLIG
jgi:hypothetical protein